MRVKCLAQKHNTMTRPGLEPRPRPNVRPQCLKCLQEPKTLIKDLEKKEAKAKSDLELFSSARQRAASSLIFFSNDETTTS